MKKPSCEPIPSATTHGPGLKLQLGGPVATYVRGVIDRWLLVAPLANPAMLEMFRDRDAPPLRDLVPWAGEFAGKYLTAAVQVLRLTQDPGLRDWLEAFVGHLLDLQAADGYLGPWPEECRLTNCDLNGKGTWDTWGHYHLMLGLTLWHEVVDDRRALRGATRIADLICDRYLGPSRPRLVDTPHTEMNLAPVHALCVLHRHTGQQRYLDMALQIVDEFAAQGEDGPLAGDYVRQALAGREFYQMPKPRWESLHPIMALAELHWITGQDRYRRAFEHLWWSMVRLERHNNGGFTSGEQATGDPYDLRPIETCCTVAWMAMSVEMLKLSGNSVVADEIELSTLNSVLGMHSPTGRWATYNTPMNGVRRASGQSIVFQAREGSPELNCCSVNSPRGFGLISEWALMRDAEGLLVNWYGPCEMQAPVGAEDGAAQPVTLIQETGYPLSGAIVLRVAKNASGPFTLKLRVPYWSRETRAWLNGQALPDPRPGSYLRVGRTWAPGDEIRLELDMSPHFWPGERACAGLTSVYRGPILLTFDHRYNLALAAGREKVRRDYDEWHAGIDLGLHVPPLDAQQVELRPASWEGWLPPLMLFEVSTADGQRVRLCDFASAGTVGTPYASWLPVESVPEHAPFSVQHPLRSVRV